MADLISRAAALDAIDGMKPMQGNMEQLVMKALCWAAVKTIQSVDAVPARHGEWKWSHGGECSECGFHNSNFDYRYCPNCGVKMDR